jgi:predicted GNAT family acetyltransferase
MVLDVPRFPGASDSGLEQLDSADYEELVGLYADGRERGESPLFFTELMLRTGVYFGVREGGELVAAAGTHVCAPELGVGDIGNVYTRHDRRQRGHGELLTAAVTAELLRRGVRTIVLNVLVENYAAIRIYERLGFVKYRCYQEGLARARRSADLTES